MLELASRTVEVSVVTVEVAGSVVDESVVINETVMDWTVVPSVVVNTVVGVAELMDADVVADGGIETDVAALVAGGRVVSCAFVGDEAEVGAGTFEPIARVGVASAGYWLVNEARASLKMLKAFKFDGAARAGYWLVREARAALKT